MSTLAAFAADEGITAAEVSGIGAFQTATVGFYHPDRKDYDRIPIASHTEVLSLLGNLSIKDDAPWVHLHATLGGVDTAAIGGHLFEAIVGPTLELFVREEPGELRRLLDEDIGLALFDLDG
jgi:predicted DNA-binding protein with PD1-like motif